MLLEEFSFSTYNSSAGYGGESIKQADFSLALCQHNLQYCPQHSKKYFTKNILVYHNPYIDTMTTPYPDESI